MKIVLVYNPKSGSALTEAELKRKCKAHDINVDQLIALDDTLSKKLTPFVKQDSVVAAIGGDGTLSAVAGALVGTKAIFAPISGGTLNHFTKDLGLPQDIDNALQELSSLKMRKIDTAAINGKVFINNASLGLYPTSLRTRDRFEDRLGKWPTAIVASLRAFIRFKTYTVTVDNETFETPFIFVGNNEYDIGVSGSIQRHYLDKGILCVYIAKTTSRLALFKIILFALIGRAKQLDEFDVRETSSFIVNTHGRRVSVSHDGEVSHFGSPLKFELKKSSLRILG